MVNFPVQRRRCALAGAHRPRAPAPLPGNPDPAQSIARVLPDVVQLMDLEQEKVARNLGEGHRTIKGVAGSGKTRLPA